MGHSVDEEAQMVADIRAQVEINGVRLASPLANIVNEQLDFPRSGFFIQYGKFPSDILNLEVLPSWTGVAIEPRADIYKQNKENRTNLYLISASLCSRIQHQQLQAKINRTKDNINYNIKTDTASSKITRTRCYPLEAYFDAFRRTRVDYLALNIPGNNKDILETFPFYRYQIDMISVVYKSESTEASLTRLELFRTLFRGLGYKESFVWPSVVVADAAQKDAKGTAVFFKRI